MAVQSEVLVFRDARALAHWLGGAVPRTPGLLGRPCTAYVLAPDPPTPGVAPSLGIVFDGLPASALPRSETNERARLVSAEIDLEQKKLRVLAAKAGILRRAQVAETFSIQETHKRPNVVQAVPLEPWAREPEDPEVIFLAPPGDAFSGLVTEHLELGKDGLRFAATEDKELGPRLLVDVARPSWFLLERWTTQQNGHGEVAAFRKLPRRRIYVAWGKRHPLEAFLVEPEASQVLLIDGEGGYRTLKVAAWKDVGEVLALESARIESQPLETARSPDRIPVKLRLEGRPKPRDPELWLLPAEERSRLERLLAQTPEEELKNLLVTLVERGSQKFFVVREVLAGRRARLLPIGGRAYACVPGLPGLFVPCDRTIAPPLRNDRYARAFAVRPGEITLLDEKEDGVITSKVEEASFRPIDTVIDFVVEGDAARLQALVAQTPFELGRFAEEDLVPPEAPAEPRRRATGKEPRDPLAATHDETPGAQPKEGVLSTIRGLFQPKDREARPPVARTADEEENVTRAATASLERELARDPTDVTRWFSLAKLRFEAQDEEDGVSCYENALWLTRSEEEEAGLKSQLSERLGAETRADATDASALYRAVFAYSQTVRGTQDPDVYRALTSRIHEQLRAQEARLRKKGRWLLWREVLRLTQDRVEEERQREDVLSDLVLRGVEDREVPTFVRRRLLERYSTASESGTARTTEAIHFLRDAEAFADATDKPAHRAAAVAHVAWAYAELGESTRAKELARAAERHASEAKGETDKAYRARALARAAAVLERIDGPNAGRRLFQEALQAIGSGLEARPQRSAEERKAFPKWFHALADARGSHATVDDALVAQGIAQLEKVEPTLRSLLLDECAEPLARLGQANRGRALARALLGRSDLQLIHLEHAASALDTFEEGRPVVVEDGRRILEVVRRAPGEIDEFAPPMITSALRAETRSPWDVADEIAQGLSRDGHAYAAAMVRLAALRRLAELKDRERGPRLLARMFEDAWAHGSNEPAREDQGRDLERMRLLVRLAQLVPAFGLRGQGLETLRTLAERAGQERSLYVRNELLSACVLAAAKLGETRETMRVLEEVVDQVLAVLREARRDARQTNSFLFEALDAAATGAAEIGDSQRGLALVERVAKAAKDELSRPSEPRAGGPEAAGRFFFYRALIRCGRAATALGDRDAAQRYFDDALSRLGETFGCDRIDLLEDAAKAANELDGDRRYALAARVLVLA
ncbi:MAG TPA: hypothetical protein VFF73_13440, partial [Planctomycetota bacterium]|nr:hypothetical protein [Planctomycetota bacterium]